MTGDFLPPVLNALTERYPVGTDFRTLDQSIEGLQRSQFIMAG